MGDGYTSAELELYQSPHTSVYTGVLSCKTHAECLVPPFGRRASNSLQHVRTKRVPSSELYFSPALGFDSDEEEADARHVTRVRAVSDCSAARVSGNIVKPCRSR